MDPYNGYMAETSEAYFWALELAPQKKETFIVNPDHVLHLTMASFGTKLVEKDRAPISMQVKNETLEMPEGDAKKVTNCTLCVLLPGVMESIPLNVILSDSTDVTFTNNSKSNTVYLTGYMTVEDSFGGYEGSSDEDFEEEEEEDSEEDNEEEQKIPVKKEEDKVQKQGNVLKGAKQTPSLPQKKQGNKEEEESDEDDIFMEEDLSDDFDLGEDSEEDEEEESDEEELQPKATNQRAKVGQKRNEPTGNEAKQTMNKKTNTPQMTPQQANQKKQNNVSQNAQQTAASGNQTTPNSQQKLTPSQKKRLRKKRKKMEGKSKADGSS